MVTVNDDEFEFRCEGFYLATTQLPKWQNKEREGKKTDELERKWEKKNETHSANWKREEKKSHTLWKTSRAFETFNQKTNLLSRTTTSETRNFRTHFHMQYICMWLTLLFRFLATGYDKKSFNFQRTFILVFARNCFQPQFWELSLEIPLRLSSF